MVRIVTFGEIMMRLSSPKGERLSDTDRFINYFGGAEANVSVFLSSLGDSASFVTKLPKNDLGRAACSFLDSKKVDTDNIIFGKGRLGLYFLEYGASQRPSKVIYDRSDSAFALSEKSEYDIEKIFENADHFHITGITPALGKGVRDLSLLLCEEAKKRKIRISVDINYREKLWDKKEACKWIGDLLSYSDICMTNAYQANSLFGTSDGIDDFESEEGLLKASMNISSKFGCEKVALSIRESISADRNILSGAYYKNGEIALSRKYDVSVVDRVGGGDAFAAGIIHSDLAGFSLKDTPEFACALEVLKHTVLGDSASFSESEVFDIISSGKGMIKR